MGMDNSSNVTHGRSSPPLNPRRPQVSHNIVLVWLSIIGCEGALVIIINLLTIVTFAINKHMLRRSVFCLLHLAAADLIVGLVALPMNFYLVGCYFGLWGTIDKTYFRASATVHVVTGMLSLFALVVISLERMCAMVWPLQHRATRTRTYVLAFCVTWLLAFAVGAIWLCNLLFFRREVSLFVWIPSLLLSLLIIGVSYAVLFIKVRSQHRQHQTVLSKATNHRERELAVTLMIVTVASIATMVPYAAVQILNFMRIPIPINTLYIAIALEYANSLVNPLVYILRMKEFRIALVRLLWKCEQHRETRNTRYRGIEKNSGGDTTSQV